MTPPRTEDLTDSEIAEHLSRAKAHPEYYEPEFTKSLEAMKTKKPKKLTLAQLCKKHGVPTMGKPHRDTILKIPDEGDYREKDGDATKAIIRKLRDLGILERSPRLTCCSGSMLWMMTGYGRKVKVGIQAMNIEREKQNERPLQPA